MVNVQADLGMTLICCSIATGGFVGLSTAGILFVDMLDWLAGLLVDARKQAVIERAYSPLATRMDSASFRRGPIPG
jgi:hypothetical protein